MCDVNYYPLFILEAPKAPSTFSWAAMISKNTPVPAAVPNTVAPPAVKAAPQVKPPEVKAEVPGPVPQPQRPQR